MRKIQAFLEEYDHSGSSKQSLILGFQIDSVESDHVQPPKTIDAGIIWDEFDGIESS